MSDEGVEGEWRRHFSRCAMPYHYSSVEFSRNPETGPCANLTCKERRRRDRPFTKLKLKPNINRIETSVGISSMTGLRSFMVNLRSDSIGGTLLANVNTAGPSGLVYWDNFSIYGEFHMQCSCDCRERRPGNYSN